MAARKVIIDTDPGIDDAVALTMALFDPRLEVVAVTATGGNVAPQQATLNIQAIIEQLDPPRWPRMGAAPQEQLLPMSAHRIHGTDGLGNCNFAVAELHNLHPAEKVITDEIRSAPGDVTLIALGPLTNIALAFQRDSSLAEQLGGLIIMGGSVTEPGNVTPAAEFNMYCDPDSARAVFRSNAPKTLIPLDITTRYVMTLDMFDQLPGESSRAGRFLRRILPYAFRSHRQELGLEGLHIHDAVAIAAVTNRELFELHDMAGDVETSGELTLGATVFDRRQIREWRRNIEVAMDVDLPGLTKCISQGLANAGNAG